MTTRKLYLYGAQSIAHGMACALRARGCGAAGYVVTERGKAPAVLDGLPVREIGELQESDDEVQFLLAVPPYLHDEIRTILSAHGYHHVTPLDAAMEYREMAAYLRDDDGETISQENPHCDELTVTYWAWKNCHDAFKGIAHYRRYLAARPEEVDALLSGKADVLLPLPFACWPDTSTQYGRYNTPEAVAAMHAALAAIHPSEADKAREILAGPYLYNYNMLLARADVFDDYCAWMFPVLAHVRTHAPELFPPDTHTRVCGHLGELLLSIYMMARKDRLRILHVPKVWLT